MYALCKTFYLRHTFHYGYNNMNVNYMQESMKLSFFRRLMVFEHIGKNITNSAGEVLRYSMPVKFISNLLLLVISALILLYCVKVRSYAPFLYGVIAAYFLVRTPVIFLIAPKFKMQKEVPFYFIVIGLAIVFLFMLLGRWVQ